MNNKEVGEIGECCKCEAEDVPVFVEDSGVGRMYCKDCIQTCIFCGRYCDTCGCADDEGDADFEDEHGADCDAAKCLLRENGTVPCKYRYCLSCVEKCKSCQYNIVLKGKSPCKLCLSAAE